MARIRYWSWASFRIAGHQLSIRSWCYDYFVCTPMQTSQRVPCVHKQSFLSKLVSNITILLPGLRNWCTWFVNSPTSGCPGDYKFYFSKWKYNISSIWIYYCVAAPVWHSPFIQLIRGLFRITFILFFRFLYVFIKFTLRFRNQSLQCVLKEPCLPHNMT